MASKDMMCAIQEARLKRLPRLVKCRHEGVTFQIVGPLLQGTQRRCRSRHPVRGLADRAEASVPG